CPAGGVRPDDMNTSGRREPGRYPRGSSRVARFPGTGRRAAPCGTALRYRGGCWAQPTFTLKIGAAATVRNAASDCVELSTRRSPPDGVTPSKYSMALMPGMDFSSGSTELKKAAFWD